MSHDRASKAVPNLAYVSVIKKVLKIWSLEGVDGLRVGIKPWDGGYTELVAR